MAPPIQLASSPRQLTILPANQPPRSRRGQPIEVPHLADPELQRRELIGPVFIAGMGRTGRTLADALSEFDIGYGAIERDEQRLREAVADGYNVAFGDLSCCRAVSLLVHGVTTEGLGRPNSPLADHGDQVHVLIDNCYGDYGVRSRAGNKP